MKPKSHILRVGLAAAIAIAGHAAAETVLVDFSIAQMAPADPAESGGNYWTSVGVYNALFPLKNAATGAATGWVMTPTKGGGNTNFGGTGINGDGAEAPFDQSFAIIDGIYSNKNDTAAAVTTLSISGMAADTVYWFSAYSDRAGGYKTGEIRTVTGTGPAAVELPKDTVTHFAITSDGSGAIAFDFRTIGGNNSVLNAIRISTDPPPAGVVQPDFTFENNGAAQSYDITVTNTGGEDLVITAGDITDDVGTDDAYFQITPTFPVTIPAQGDGTITFQFTPGAGLTGNVGPVDLNLTSNAGGTAGTVTTSAITGTMRNPWISVTNEPVNLGPFPGGTAAQSFTVDLSNLGASETLSIFNTSNLDPADGAFTIDTDLSADLDIAHGGTGSLALTFDAGGVPGTYTAILYIDSNDPVDETHQVAITATITHDPILEAPASVPVGPVVVGDTTPVDFTVQVTNTGEANDLALTTPTLTGTNAALFSVGAFDTPVAAAGGTGEIHLVFNPPATKGTYTATLSIPSNDLLTPTTEVLLVANVVGPAADHLVLHYEFEDDQGGTTAASSVNPTADNTLNLNADSAWAAGQPGFGNAVSLNNAKGAITATDPTSWAMATPDTSVTLAFWVKLDGVSGKFSPTLVGAIDPANPYKHQYMIRANAANLQANAFVRDADKAHTIQTAQSAATAIPVDTWTHLAMTLEATTGELKYYMNGQEVANASNAAWAGWGPASDITQAGVGDGTYSTSGLFDDIRIYNRVLTQAEIATLVPSSPAVAGMQLVLNSYTSSIGIADITVNNVPTGQTFHIEKSTDLENWAPLDIPFEFTSETDTQNVNISIGTGPKIFLQVFEGPNP